MKRIVSVFGAILLAIVVGILVVQEQKKETDITLEKTKVVMLMNGSHDDHSWGESHYNAMTKVSQKLNLAMEYIENVPEDSTAELLMEKHIANGAKIVICNSFGFGTHELNVAARHPEVKFFHATGVSTSPNMSTFFGRIYQMRYLSGIVAGLKTKTNEIGYVAAFDIPEVVRGINAFTLGVQKVNPDAKVFVSWSRSWVDEKLSTDATNDLIAKHNIDVMTVHTDALTPYEIAEKNNVWIIGYNLDNGKRFPKRFLTAPVWQWENFYEPRILEVLQNKFVGRKYWLGAESGMIGLAPMTEHVSDSIRQIVDAEMERLTSGTFDVFYGPVMDNQGTVRIEAGESMTDVDMLENFNWYVKGVVNE